MWKAYSITAKERPGKGCPIFFQFLEMPTYLCTVKVKIT